MSEGEQQPQRRRVENFPATGMRRFASFSQVVGLEESQRYTANMRARLAEEDRREREATSDIGLIAMLEPPQDNPS